MPFLRRRQRRLVPEAQTTTGRQCRAVLGHAQVGAYGLGTSLGQARAVVSVVLDMDTTKISDALVQG